MKKLKAIKMIAPSSISTDETLKSWERQLLEYLLLKKNLAKLSDEPLIVNDNSERLNFSNISDNPIIITSETIDKIINKHNLEVKFLLGLKGIVNNPVFSMDSIQHQDSKIFVTNKKNENQLPIIFVLRKDKLIADAYEVNEIASVYDKKNLQNLIYKTLEAGGKVYVNPVKRKEFEDMGYDINPKVIEKEEKSKNPWLKKLENKKGLER